MSTTSCGRRDAEQDLADRAAAPSASAIATCILPALVRTTRSGRIWGPVEYHERVAEVACTRRSTIHCLGGKARLHPTTRWSRPARGTIQQGLGIRGPEGGFPGDFLVVASHQIRLPAFVEGILFSASVGIGRFVGM